MSIASVGFSVSAIAGVPLGLWLSGYWSWRGVFCVLTAATVAAACALVLVLGGRPAAAQVAQPQPQRPGLSLVATRSILTATKSVLVVSFLAFAAVGLVYTYLVIELTSVWHWSNKILLGFLCLYGIANVAGNLVLGRLGDLWGKDRAVRIGQTVEFIALLGIAGASFWYWAWVLALALILFGFGQAYILDLKAMASEVAPELRGRGQAWNNAAMYGGMMAGSWVASYGYQVIGFNGLLIAAAAVVALSWSITEASAQKRRSRHSRRRRNGSD
jgi:predicted MFS family arabinose efflux permease